jgi:hypothetical protein
LQERRVGGLRASAGEAEVTGKEQGFRDFWHGELRPGDAHGATGTVWLLRACLAKLPATVSQIRVVQMPRFSMTKWSEPSRHTRGKLIIVAQLMHSPKAVIPGLTCTEVRRDLAIAECRHQPHGWPQPYRFVVKKKMV